MKESEVPGVYGKMRRVSDATPYGKAELVRQV